MRFDHLPERLLLLLMRGGQRLRKFGHPLHGPVDALDGGLDGGVHLAGAFVGGPLNVSEHGLVGAGDQVGRKHRAGLVAEPARTGLQALAELPERLVEAAEGPFLAVAARLQFVLLVDLLGVVAVGLGEGLQVLLHSGQFAEALDEFADLPLHTQDLRRVAREGALETAQFRLDLRDLLLDEPVDQHELEAGVVRDALDLVLAVDVRREERPMPQGDARRTAVRGGHLRLLAPCPVDHVTQAVLGLNRQLNAAAAKVAAD